ncbi:hypothetical protein MMC13_002844 [Lambiella insularis]|nr:hypothetical protein [Lambiella insularis]
MATFLTDLFESIFTPGPTPTLLVATNAAFAALQAVLLTLLVATYSVHFIVLSFLCGGLWWGINWFAAEVKAANEKERDKEAGPPKNANIERDTRSAEDSGTETEGAAMPVQSAKQLKRSEGGLMPIPTDDMLRKRRSLGEVSGTDSEWDKVENEGDDL